MNATVETLDDNKTKITVTVDAADVDAKAKQVYKEYATKYNFPGFRKGKAPRPVIDNALGKEAILAAITEEVINSAYPEMIEQERLYPVGSPEFGDPSTVELGQPFTFEVTVGKKPEVTLTSYDPVEIEIPSAQATESEIQGQVDYILHHYETYEDAPKGTPLGADTYATLDMKAYDEDGTEIESLSADARFYIPGAQLLPESFDKEVEGMAEGDSRTFTLDIADDEKALLVADLGGKKVKFDVTCTKVQSRQVPELTDEWVKETLKLDSAEAFRNEIADSITKQKEAMVPHAKENACAAKLVERVEEDVPENMAEEAEAELLQDFFNQLQRRGMSFDEYLAGRGIDSKQFKEDIKLQAQDEAKQQLALDAWAKEKGIDVTDEEVTHEFEVAGLDDPKKTEREWKQSGKLYMIREGIVRRKAMREVIDTAIVTEAVEDGGDKKDEDK